MKELGKIKQVFFGFMAVVLMTACSAEEELGQEPQLNSNIEWKPMSFSAGVEQGTVVETRAKGELDDNDLPVAAYPAKLGIYMHKTDLDGKVSGTLTINEEGSNDNRFARFVYGLDETKNYIYIKKNKTDSDDEQYRLKCKIAPQSKKEGAYPDDCDVFFFTSLKESGNIPFPEAKNNTYDKLFPDAREEFGDRLFVSKGYFFRWKADGSLGLFTIQPNDYKSDPAGEYEVVELPNWNEAELNLVMNRLTACVTVRLMLIERYDSDGSPVSLFGEEDLTDKFEAVNKTNAALREFVAKGSYSQTVKDYFKDFDVQDIFVRKKLFTNYPPVYDWQSGLNTKKSRIPLYLCNLDHPSWIDATTRYEISSKLIVYSLTATCDNEPFIPTTIDGRPGIPGLSLVLFLGIGDHETGTYKNLVPFKISLTSDFSVTPNTHTYVYIGVTLKDIVDLYRHLSGEAQPDFKTRSASSMPEIVLPSNQLFITSEPYTGQHAH